MADRPLLIAIIAVLTILMGLVLILGGVGMIGLDHVDGIDDGVLNIFGYSFLIIGILALIIGFGLWNGWTIMWYLGLILYAISAIYSIYIIITVTWTQAFSLVIALILIYYLLTPKVKAFFKV